VDLHAPSIKVLQYSRGSSLCHPSLARYFKSIMQMEDIVVVSPDSGGANRALALAKKAELLSAIGDKRRSGNNDQTNC
jgi:ribose-phosphate pyrophosphokinase